MQEAPRQFKQTELLPAIPTLLQNILNQVTNGFLIVLLYRAISRRFITD